MSVYISVCVRGRAVSHDVECLHLSAFTLVVLVIVCECVNVTSLRQNNEFVVRADIHAIQIIDFGHCQTKCCVPYDPALLLEAVTCHMT